MIQSYAFALELNLGFDACAQRAWSKSVGKCCAFFYPSTMKALTSANRRFKF